MKLSINLIIFIGFCLRLGVAVWNSFYGPSPGADLDAQGLHGFASDVADSGIPEEFHIGYIPYINFLGMVYRMTIHHLFWGCIVSCLAWAWSADLLRRSLALARVEQVNIRAAILIYALLPSSVFLTAVTLREPYQMMFVNLALFSVFQIHIYKKRLYWVVMTMGLAGAGVLHGGMLAFGLIFLAGTMLLEFGVGRAQTPWWLWASGACISLFVLWAGFTFFGEVSYSLDKGLGVAVETYQRGVVAVVARTNYRTDIHIDDTLDLILFVPVALLQYLFEPFPWHIGTADDLLLLGENMLRGWLIFKAWRALRGNTGSLERQQVFAIFCAYWIAEMIWALGTGNWGTAVRHHLPSLGLLLLSAYGIDNKSEAAHGCRAYA